MINWINASERLPEEKEPVIFCKNDADNLDNAYVGCLVKNEEGTLGWFVDGDGENYKVLTIQSRNYWIPLLNKAFLYLISLMLNWHLLCFFILKS